MTIAKETQRIFMPGEKWLYYKLYSGPKSLDLFLINEILPFTNQLVSQNIIDRFHFVRYTDPDYHIRLRFHLNSVNDQNIIILALAEKLKHMIANRLVWKVTIDSYERELERYGSNSIEYVENLFHFNSSIILSILAHDEIMQEDNRWLWGIKYIDMLLDEFQVSISNKIQLFEKLSNGYGAEFNMNKPLRLKLDKKFRKNKSQIEAFISNNKTTDKKLQDIISISIADSKISINKILNLKEGNRLEVPLESLLSSIIHMHYNRLFRTQQRLHELVIYYSMHKYYKSMAARMKYNR